MTPESRANYEIVGNDEPDSPYGLSCEQPGMSAKWFSGARFHEVYSGLDNETRAAINAKALEEHTSLSVVMREWWPELWALVAPPGGVFSTHGDGPQTVDSKIVPLSAAVPESSDDAR